MEINNIGKGTEERAKHDDDRLSALPDDVLLAVLQLLDAGTAVRVGALARRWRHLRCLLPDLTIDVADLVPRSPDPSSPCRTVGDMMTAYTAATAWFLTPNKQRSIKSLRLTFYLVDPYLRSIGDAVAKSGGSAAGPLEFTILADVDVLTVNDAERAMLARRFMSFLAACPVAFSGLTRLSLQNLCFGDSDISDLLGTCGRLELLSLSQCGSSSEDMLLRIDAPTSSLQTLEIREPFFHGVELTSMPKLERLFCDEDVDSFDGSRPAVRFGHVPCLDDVYLSTIHLRYYYENPGAIHLAHHGACRVPEENPLT